MGTLANVGARTVGVEMDSEGMLPEALEQALTRRKAGGELARVKAIYLSTYYDNPAGITTTLTRRQQVLDVARRWSLTGRDLLDRRRGLSRTGLLRRRRAQPVCPG